jgi:Uma2 family endonuclease
MTTIQTRRRLAMSVASKLMTTEELLALPDNGMDRDLIRGELREKPMTTRGGPHCITMTNLATLLTVWQRRQAMPRGRVYTGDARTRLRRNPDTFVGADIAYLSPEHASRTDRKATFIEGPPSLAIEILSPSDTHEDVSDKAREYLAAGVALLWIVDPDLRTVTVYRPEAHPEIFGERQALTAEPHLPGFRVPVAEVFEA